MMRANAFANRETAAYYLQEIHNRAHTDRKMRVLFLVHDPVIWDKQQPVYDVFAADATVETVIVLVPTYKATDVAAQNSRWGGMICTIGSPFMSTIPMSMTLPMLTICVFLRPTISFCRPHTKPFVHSAVHMRANLPNLQSFVTSHMGHRG